MKKRIFAFIMSIMLVFTSTFATYNTSDILNKTSQIVQNLVKNPVISSVGGEWALIGIARNGNSSLSSTYFKNVSSHLNSGVIHDKKYTEYARVVLAIGAIGGNPLNVNGFNLISPLTDYEKTIFQGINGAIWALIALDSNGYDCDAKQKYVDYILNAQLSDGGFALSGTVSDPDITGMALQALSNYTSQKKVSTAIEKALAYLSNAQNSNAGFTSSEAIIQVIVALCSLDISINDSMFVKNGNTLFDALMNFYVTDKGFKHLETDENVDQMSTEQALYALVAINRQENNKNFLYDMSDVSKIDYNTHTTMHEDVKIVPVSNASISFNDTTQSYIKNLASRGIINGKGNGNFAPLDNMTRAEFATIIVRALGLTPNSSSQFFDVLSSDWFAPYVGTAEKYQIVNGVSYKNFDPNGTITREQAMVMIERASKLCGTYKSSNTASLSGFSDYKNVSSWALSSVAYCYENSIADTNDKLISPKTNITRDEVAKMVYNLLKSSNLLT